MADKLGEIFVEVKAKIDKMEADLKTLRKRSENEGKKAGDSFGKKFGTSFKSQIKSIGGMIAGVFAVGAVVNFGKKLIQTASDFEQIRTRLKSLYGDAEIATKVFNEFKKVAATTPFSLKDVAKGGITLKAFGLDAEKTLKSATDLAAFMGTSVPEAAAAMGRAFAGGAGAADILRERGILNLIKDFKGVDDLTKLTLPEFRKAMLETFVDPAAGIAGATNDLSKTYSGAISNMGDAWDNFAAAIATGALPAIGGLARGISSLLTKMTPVKHEADEQLVKFNILARTYDNLSKKVNLTKGETQLYNETIKTLKKEYGKYLTNIDLEKDGYDKVKTAIEGARLQLIEYAKAQALLRMQKEMQDEISAAYQKEIEATKQLAEWQEKRAKEQNQYQIHSQQTLFYTQQIMKYENEIKAAQEFQTKKGKELVAFSSKYAEMLNLALETQSSGQDKVNEKLDQQNDKLTEIVAKHEAIIELAGNIRIPVDQYDTQLMKINEVYSNFMSKYAFMQRMGDNFANHISGAILEMADSNKKAFEAIADAFKNMLTRMVAEYTAKAAIFGLLNLFTGGTYGLATGGFRKAVFGFAGGGDFIVPPGYQNDSFPMAVSSGERVQVTPANQVQNNNNYSTSNNNTFNMPITANKLDENYVYTELIPTMRRVIKNYNMGSL